MEEMSPWYWRLESGKPHHRLNHKETETWRERRWNHWPQAVLVKETKEKDVKQSNWTETLLLVSKFCVGVDQNASVTAASELWSTQRTWEGSDFEKVCSKEDLEKLSFTSIKISSGQLSKEGLDITTKRKSFENWDKLFILLLLLFVICRYFPSLEQNRQFKY